MKSMTPPTSRRMACAITPATWRWCAAAKPRSRSCWHRRRLRSKARSMRGAAAIAAASAGTLRRPAPADGRGDRLAARRPAARTLHRAAARRGGPGRAGARRAGAAVPQPARLCAADLVPRLRPSDACPNCDAWLVDHRFQRRLVCHHCGFLLPPPATCPKCEAAGFSFVAGRSRRRAARRGGGRAVSGRRILVLSQRSGRIDRAAARRNSTMSPRAASTSSSARSLSPRDTIFRSSIWSASSMPISASEWRSARRRAHVPAAASGRRAAPGARQGRGVGFLQTHQPEHPVMRALIAATARPSMPTRSSAREDRYPPFGRLASLVVSGGDKHATEGLCPEARRGRAARRAGAPAGSGGGAARCRARPPPLSSAGQVAAPSICRPTCANGSRRPQNEEDAQARGRRRSSRASSEVHPGSRPICRLPTIGRGSASSGAEGRRPGHRRQGGHSMPVFSRIAALAFVGLSSLFRPPDLVTTDLLPVPMKSVVWRIEFHDPVNIGI